MINQYDDLNTIQTMCQNDISLNIIIDTIETLKLKTFYASEDMISTEGILSATKEKISNIIKSYRFRTQRNLIELKEQNESRTRMREDLIAGMNRIKKLRGNQDFVNGMRAQVFGFNFKLIEDYMNVISIIHNSYPLIYHFTDILKKIKTKEDITRLHEAENKIYQYFKSNVVPTKTKTLRLLTSKTGYHYLHFTKDPFITNGRTSYDQWFGVFDRILNSDMPKWESISREGSETIPEHVLDAYDEYKNTISKLIDNPSFNKDDLAYDLGHRGVINLIILLWEPIDNIIQYILKKMESFVKHSNALNKIYK